MSLIKKQSPNYTPGRESTDIDRLVIHWIGAGTASGAVNHFLNNDSDVSAHYLISDKQVWQFVEEYDTAWHAGNWEMNLRSVGIEHDAIPGRPATAETYETSGKLVREICDEYNIPMDRTHIIGHKDVKATQCPGTMDLDKIIAIAKGAELVPDIPLKDRIIDWADFEGNSHEVGWYVYEWRLEKRTALRQVEEIKEKIGDYERIQGTLAEVNQINTTLIGDKKGMQKSIDIMGKKSGELSESLSKQIKAYDVLTKSKRAVELKLEALELKLKAGLSSTTFWEFIKSRFTKLS